MLRQRSFQEIEQALGLPEGFEFAQFRQASPLDDNSVWELLLERQQAHLTVKRADRAQDNLRRLFEATFRLANKVGFVSMTLRDLSRETGLSMGGIYGYISSKDDIATMVEDMVNFIIQIMPAWFTNFSQAEARLEAALRGHIYLTELLQPWFYFVFMESRLLSGAQKQLAKSAEMQLHAELIERITAAGVRSPEQAQMLAAHSAAIVQDWVVKRWKYRQLGMTVDAFAAHAADLVRQRVQSLR
jgi:AcrR family transcriptional regulator